MLKLLKELGHTWMPANQFYIKVIALKRDAALLYVLLSLFHTCRTLRRGGRLAHSNFNF